MPRITLAGADDEAALDAFLVPQTDTSMFLRANLQRAGLTWDGQRYQAQYVLAWHGAAVVGVVGHAWNGMVQIQAADDVAALACAATATSGRPVRGLIGPLAQVTAARHALGLDQAPTSLDADESLMALELAHLRVPAALVSSATLARRATHADVATLAPWQLAYDHETSGIVAAADALTRATTGLAEDVDDGVLWVAEREGALVAMTTFGARLPACVQINGVYTPPALRNRGHARVAVAGSLLDARATGTAHAVLFAKDPAALATYRALGFAEVGRLGLVLFAPRVMPAPHRA